MQRMAGSLLGALLAGSGGAVAADLFAHDDLDRAAQDYKGFVDKAQGMPSQVQQIYSLLTGGGEMSSTDRAAIIGVLDGAADKVMAQLGGVPSVKQIQADTTAGQKAIHAAMQVRAQDPALAGQVNELVRGDLELIAKEQEKGMNPAQVMQAAQQGAGVSPLPAILGGLLGGAAGAGGVALGRRLMSRG